MKKKVRNSLLFLAAIISLQQISYWLGKSRTSFRDQKLEIIARDIDPAAFFYTESEIAMESVKKIRTKHYKR